MSQAKKGTTWRRKPGWYAMPFNVIYDRRLQGLGWTVELVYRRLWDIAAMTRSGGALAMASVAPWLRGVPRYRVALDALKEAGVLREDTQSASYILVDWPDYNRADEDVSAGQDAYTSEYGTHGGSMDIESNDVHSVDKVQAECAQSARTTEQTGTEREDASGKSSLSVQNADDAPARPPAAGAAGPGAPVRSKINGERPTFARPAEGGKTSAERIAELRRLPKAERLRILNGTDDPGDRDPTTPRASAVAGRVPEHALASLPPAIQEHLRRRAAAEAADAETAGNPADSSQNGRHP